MTADALPMDCNGNYASEVSIMSSYIQSQKYARYFFSDFDSTVRPLPAGGLFLTAERRIARNMHFIGSFSAPLKEELVRYADGHNEIYYFPKIFSVGLDWNPMTFHLPEGACVETRITGGIGTPLSYRFGKLIAPFILYRLRIDVTQNTGLNIGMGYSGIVSQGAYFFPIGFSYRL